MNVEQIKKRIIPCLIIALLVAFATYKISLHYIDSATEVTNITITALDEKNQASTSKEVTLRGAVVDGAWYNVGDVVTAGDWIEDAKDKTITWYGDLEGQSITISIPPGVSRSVIFNVGPNQGKVKISVGEQFLIYDLFNESSISSGKAYELPTSEMREMEKKAVYLATTMFIISMALFLVLSRNFNPPESKSEREVWGGLLRGFCAFIIVWLHSTSNLFYSFGNSISSWYPDLIINSFTAFAVPCFFMLSGAYLLRREHGVKDVLVNRIPKMFLPLLFWSIVYIVIDGNPIPSSFITMFFQNQTPHLWFMYSLFGIYMLLPLLSKLYMRLDRGEKIYLLILLLVIPGLLHDFQYLLGYHVSMPHFVVFWPDLGLFFLGGVLWDAREKISKKWKLSIAGIFIGLAITVAMTVFTSLRQGSPDNNFISTIGSVGVVLNATSFFTLTLSLENRLQNIKPKVKRIIHMFDSVSLGVYLIHVLLMRFIGTQTLFGFDLTSNSGSQLNMFAGATMYFAASVLVCWAGKKIPIIQKVF